MRLPAGYSFRNAPHFVPFGIQDPPAAAAIAETEALIRHVFEHSNTAPFTCKLLIQRLVTSNPSPRYVAAVVEAFRTGTYDGTTYSGVYGDLGATLAAILLDREARSSALLADPTHGRLREPLLKVVSLMRAMDFSSKGGREVELEGLTAKIGQMARGRADVSRRAPGENIGCEDVSRRAPGENWPRRRSSTRAEEESRRSSPRRASRENY